MKSHFKGPWFSAARAPYEDVYATHGVSEVRLGEWSPPDMITDWINSDGLTFSVRYHAQSFSLEGDNLWVSYQSIFRVGDRAFVPVEMSWTRSYDLSGPTGGGGDPISADGLYNVLADFIGGFFTASGNMPKIKSIGGIYFSLPPLPETITAIS